MLHTLTKKWLKSSATHISASGVYKQLDEIEYWRVSLNMIDNPLLKTLSMQSLNDTAKLRPSAGDLAGALDMQMRLQQLEDNTLQNQEILSLQPHLSQERYERTFSECY